MPSDDEDLPSLEEIFSKPITFKRAKFDEEKENVEKNVKRTAKIAKKAVESTDNRSDLKINTPVFVLDHFNGKYVPAIIFEEHDCKNDFYKVKLYDGRIENLGRRFIYCQEDAGFYSIKAIPLKDAIAAKNSLIRKFDRKAMLKIVKKYEDELKGVLSGDLESSRDIVFRSAYQNRSSLNTGNMPGPFTMEEYNFFMEHIPQVLVPTLLENDLSLREKLEKRFKQSGDSLDHTLRQYSYLVLVPEFTARHILKLDKSLKTVEEAFEKLYNDVMSFDLETGNFINYLYSSQEMYRLARREKIE